MVNCKAFFMPVIFLIIPKHLKNNNLKIPYRSFQNSRNSVLIVIAQKSSRQSIKNSRDKILASIEVN